MHKDLCEGERDFLVLELASVSVVNTEVLFPAVMPGLDPFFPFDGVHCDSNLNLLVPKVKDFIALNARGSDAHFYHKRT